MHSGATGKLFIKAKLKKVGLQSEKRVTADDSDSIELR